MGTPRDRGYLGRARDVLMDHPEYSLLGLIILFNLYTVRNIFSGMPVGIDQPPQFNRIWFLDSYLLPRLRLSGWFPYWYCGFPMFYFYPPLAFLLPVLIHRISFGMLPLLTAYQISVAMGHVFLPIGVFILARTLDLSREGALVSALFSLTIGSPYSGGLVGNFWMGLYPSSLGVSLFPLVLASFIRLRRDPGTRNAILAGTCLGAIVLTHLLSAYFLLMSVVLILGLEALLKRDGERGGHLLLALLTSGVLTLFWTIPLYSNYGYTSISRDHAPQFDVSPVVDLSTTVTALARTLFTTYSVIGKLAGVGSPLLGALALASILLSIRSRSNGVLLALFFLLLFLSLGAPGAMTYMPFRNAIQHQYVRAPTYLGIVCCLFAGKLCGIPSRKGAKAAAPVLLVILFLLFAAPKVLSESEEHVRTDGDHNDSTGELGPALEWIEDNIGPEGRIAAEFHWDMTWSFGSPHYLHSTVPLVPRQEVSGLNHELSPVSLETLDLIKDLGGKDLDTLYPEYQRFGVTHVLTWMPDSTDNFDRSDRFAQVYKGPRIAIFEMKDAAGIVEVPGTVTSVELGPEHVRIELDDVARGDLLLKVTSFPNWEAYVNGERVEITPRDNFMTVPLVGQEHAVVEFMFRQSSTETVPGLASLCGLVLVILYLSGSYRGSFPRSQGGTGES
ncbi:MAG: hypothetical protein QGG50_00410 [Methanopyri archaeon]|nr:hypothetical protein [Methanopyri archaeon]